MAGGMKLYYRHRDKGVTVFRMEVANRQRRIELNQIASIMRDGEIIPHKRRHPTEVELAEISVWWNNWLNRSEAGEITEIESFISQLNIFTDWLARRADHDDVDVQSDALLTALLDLRQVVVRRLSEDPTGDGED